MTHTALALMITLTTAALMNTHLRVLSAAVVLLLPRLATMMISTFTIMTIMDKYVLRHKQALAWVEVTLPPLLLDYIGTQVNKFSPLSKSQ